MATKLVWTEDDSSGAFVRFTMDKTALPDLMNVIHRGLYLCRERGSVGPALAEDLDELLRIWQKMID